MSPTQSWMLAVAATSISITSPGCQADRGVDFTISGVLVEADTGAAFLYDAIGGRLITGDTITSDLPARVPENNSNGAFELTFSELVGCGIFPYRCPDEDDVIPCPDSVELIIVQGGCEQTVEINIATDTCVDRKVEIETQVMVPDCMG